MSVSPKALFFFFFFFFFFFSHLLVQATVAVRQNPFIIWADFDKYIAHYSLFWLVIQSIALSYSVQPFYLNILKLWQYHDVDVCRQCSDKLLPNLQSTKQLSVSQSVSARGYQARRRKNICTWVVQHYAGDIAVER